MTRTLLPLLLLLLGAPAQADEPTPPSSPLTVEVRGVPSSEGLMQVAIYGPDGFPKTGKQVLGLSLPAQKGAMTVRFEAVPPGTYAVAIFHDSNSNHELDTNAFGMPTEDYAFSNNARGVFGPPKFEKASFTFSGALSLVIDLD